MAAAWTKLIKANDDEGADKVEKAGKEAFGDDEFGEAMAEAVQNV